MSLRVAFDLDGTVADMQRVLRVEAERLFGPNPSGTVSSETPSDAEPVDVPADVPLTRSQQSALWDHVKSIDNFWMSLPEMQPGIVRRIAEAAHRRRWEVLFLTTRPLVAGDTVQVQSQRWLQAHGFPLPSVYVVQRSRGKVADALQLDAVVDDRPENCLDVVLDSQAVAILVWPGDATKVPLGLDKMAVRVVHSITSAVDLLIKMDEERQPNMARMLRKLLGKETNA
jgi:hypothetical protein